MRSRHGRLRSRFSSADLLIFTQQDECLVADILDGKSVLSEHDLSRGGSSEPLHPDDSAAASHVTMPAERRAGFYSQPLCHLLRENRVAVLLRLCIEKLPAGH